MHHGMTLPGGRSWSSAIRAIDRAREACRNSCDSLHLKEDINIYIIYCVYIYIVYIYIHIYIYYIYMY